MKNVPYAGMWSQRFTETENLTNASFENQPSIAESDSVYRKTPFSLAYQFNRNKGQSSSKVSIITCCNTGMRVGRFSTSTSVAEVSIHDVKYWLEYANLLILIWFSTIVVFFIFLPPLNARLLVVGVNVRGLSILCCSLGRNFVTMRDYSLPEDMNFEASHYSCTPGLKHFT